MPEIKSHTSLRGIAAFLVVLFHYKTNLNFEDVIDSATGFLETADRFVDFFFMLSGFVMAYVYLERIGQPGEKAAFFISRIARIYPLHILTLTIMVCIAAYKVSLASNEITGSLMQNILLIHAWGTEDAFMFNFPSWSISGEFAAYLMFPLLSAIVLHSVWSQVALVAAAVCSVLVEHHLVHTGIPWERLGLFRAVPLFAIGIVLYAQKDLVSRLSNRLLNILQTSSLLAVVIAMHHQAALISFMPLFAVLIASTCSDRGVLPRLLDNAPLYGLGLISYTVYLLHVPVRAVGYYVWPQLNFLVPAGFRDAAFVAICVVVTFASSIIVYRFFEMPMRQKLRAKLSSTSLTASGR